MVSILGTNHRLNDGDDADAQTEAVVPGNRLIWGHDGDEDGMQKGRNRLRNLKVEEHMRIDDGLPAAKVQTDIRNVTQRLLEATGQNVD